MSFRMQVPPLKQITSKQVNMVTRMCLTRRVEEITEMKLSLTSLASEQLALSLIGKLIEDFDLLRGKLKDRIYDFKRINTLQLRVRNELNVIYNQISNGLDACMAFPPHQDGECLCYEALYTEALSLINFIRERLF